MKSCCLVQFKGKKSQYNVCLCGGGACGSGGITAMDSGGSAKNLGNFTSLSVSSSTGGPRFAYYNGDSCGSKKKKGTFLDCYWQSVASGYDRKDVSLLRARARWSVHHPNPFLWC